MKKVLVIAIVLLVSVSYSNVSFGNNGYDEPYNFRGKSLLGGGFSLGYYNYGFFGTRSLSVPPINAYYELGVHEFITVGPFIGFGRWGYRYLNTNYAWTFTTFGGRGSVHVTRFINELFDNDIDDSKIDFYITMLVGLEVRTWSYDGTTLSNLYDNQYSIFLGPIGGVRYYFANNFAFYVEGGRGALGAFTVGVSTRF